MPECVWFCASCDALAYAASSAQSFTGSRIPSVEDRRRPCHRRPSLLRFHETRRNYAWAGRPTTAHSWHPMKRACRSLNAQGIVENITNLIRQLSLRPPCMLGEPFGI